MFRTKVLIRSKYSILVPLVISKGFWIIKG